MQFIYYIFTDPLNLRGTKISKEKQQNTYYNQFKDEEWTLEAPNEDAPALIRVIYDKKTN